MGDVGGDARAPQRPVVLVPDAHDVDVGGRLRLVLLGPQVLVVPQDRRLGLDAGALDLAELAEAGAQFADLAPDLGVGAGVRHHPRVPLLGALPGGAPLEEHDRVGAARQVRHGVAQHLARGLGAVAALPVDRGGGVLHEDPGGAAAEGAGEVGGVAEVDVPGGAFEVVVVGDDVDGLGELPQVDVGVVAGHEVRRHGLDRVDRAEQFGLGPVELEQLPGREALEVEDVGGVGDRRRRQGREDLVPGGVRLRPERGAPRRVEAVEVGVALAQPGAELGGGRRGVRAGVVAAVLVVDVPQLHGGVVVVAAGHLLGDAQGLGEVDVRGGVEALAGAVGEAAALGVDRERLGVGGGEPGGRGGGGGGEADLDAARVEEVEDLVEPVELEPALLGLELGPGEDADADAVDAGLAHQAHVLVPDLARPLLGVVIAAVDDRHVTAPSLCEGRCASRLR